MEGDPIGDDLIYCNALANPAGNYYWTTSNSDHIMTIGRHLTFNVTSSGVTREQSGNYTCVVTNRHGMASATMTISVLCMQLIFINLIFDYYLLPPQLSSI